MYGDGSHEMCNPLGPQSQVGVLKSCMGLSENKLSLNQMLFHVFFLSKEKCWCMCVTV